MKTLNVLTAEKEKLGIDLSLSAPIQPVALQLDDYSSFSHQYNIGEQTGIMENLTEYMEGIIRNRGMVFESFRYSDDMIVFLVNLSHVDEQEELKEWFELNHGILLEKK